MKDKSGHTITEAICECCGKTYYKSTRNPKQKYCSVACMGKSQRADRTKICPICNKTFEYKYSNKDQKYCSNKCSAMARANKKTIKCDYCGKEFERILSAINKRQKHYCSNECCYLDKAGKERNKPSNGIIMQEGYVFLHQKPNQYKAKHRIVMEQHLGRKLSSNEIVHHIDGNKTNNDISNLVLVTRAEHVNIHRKQLLESRKIKKGY